MWSTTRFQKMTNAIKSVIQRATIQQVKIIYYT